MTEPRASSKSGLGTLPRKWSTVVQLVGTFGLAVFLVLYYLLVMEPRQALAYDSLRTSVDGLRSIVEKRQALLSRTQADALDQLFVMALAGETALKVRSGLDSGASAERIEQTVREWMVDQTHWLQGLVREDGLALSETTLRRIVDSRIAQQIAERAVTEWRQADALAITRGCQEMIGQELRRRAMAK